MRSRTVFAVVRASTAYQRSCVRHKPFCPRQPSAVRMMSTDRTSTPAPLGPLPTITALPIAACSPNAYCSLLAPAAAAAPLQPGRTGKQGDDGKLYLLEMWISALFPPVDVFLCGWNVTMVSKRHARYGGGYCSTHTQPICGDTSSTPETPPPDLGMGYPSPPSGLNGPTHP